MTAANKGNFKSQLLSALALRDKLKVSLNELESEIYRTEELYLEQNMEIGNIVKGFEQCSRVIREAMPLPVEKRLRSPRKSIRSSDRIFSSSSVTWQPTVVDEEETESEEGDDDSDEDASPSEGEETPLTPVRKLAPAKRLRVRMSQDL